METRGFRNYDEIQAKQFTALDSTSYPGASTQVTATDVILTGVGGTPVTTLQGVTDVVYPVNGFLTRGDPAVDLAFDWATRVFTIYNTGTIYSAGNELSITTTQTLTLADTTGPHYIYYSGVGVLTESLTAFPDNICQVAIVYMRISTDVPMYVYLLDRRFSTRWYYANRDYLQTAIKGVYVSGLEMSYFNTGAVANPELRFQIADGVIYNEDLEISIANVTGGQELNGGATIRATVPILYRDGDDELRVANNAGYGVLYSGSDIQYNTGSDTHTTVTLNYFVPYFYFATADGTWPVVGASSQNQYATYNELITNLTADIADVKDLIDIPGAVLFGVVVFQETGAGGVLVQHPELANADYINESIPTFAYSHGGFIGLNSDDHPQYSLLGNTITAVTASYPVVYTDGIIPVDTTGGAYTITLPTSTALAPVRKGQRFIIYDSGANAAVNNITIAGGTIVGATSITTNGGSVEAIATGVSDTYIVK